MNDTAPAVDFRPEAMIGASLDPITNGHLWMIEQAVKRFRLHIALPVNPNKKYTFDEKMREDVLVQTLGKRFGNRAREIRVHVIPHLYLAKFAASINVNLLLRGIRNQDDFKYERSLLLANAKVEPGIDTIFMIPPRDLEDVSSSFVKGWIGPDGWEKQINDFVPGPAYYALLDKFKGVYYCLGVEGKMGKGCGALLSKKERDRVRANHGGYCDKCIGQYKSFAESR